MPEIRCKLSPKTNNKRSVEIFFFSSLKKMQISFSLLYIVLFSTIMELLYHFPLKTIKPRKSFWEGGHRAPKTMQNVTAFPRQGFQGNLTDYQRHKSSFPQMHLFQSLQPYCSPKAPHCCRLWACMLLGESHQVLEKMNRPAMKGDMLPRDGKERKKGHSTI